MSTHSRLRRRAIALAQAGNNRDARPVFEAVLHEDPHDQVAWFHYVDTLTTPNERIVALKRFLRVEPGNRRAQRALWELWEKKCEQPPAVRWPPPDLFRYSLLFGALVILLGAVAGFLYLRHEVLTQWANRYEALSLEHEALQALHADLVRGHAVLVAEQQRLEGDYDRLLGESEALQSQNGRLQAERDELQIRYDQLQSQYGQVQAAYDELTSRYDELQGQYRQMQAERDALQSEHDELSLLFDQQVGEYNRLADEYNRLVAEHETLAADYDELSQLGMFPPYVYMKSRRAHVVFEKLDSTVDQWEVPFDNLEGSILRGDEERQALKTLYVTDAETGRQYDHHDFRPFVEPGPFETVMSTLYWDAESDDAFIREVWNIIRQMTTYEAEEYETPRFPSETLLAGGGDCEDTSILFASMIKAAPVDWDVGLVYLDGDHPYAPEELNHVMVCVDTGSRRYWVETTSKDEMEPFGQVAGWVYWLE